eukprot:jgi/Botrbrau1/21576/Bobra.174_2s0071.1
MYTCTVLFFQCIIAPILGCARLNRRNYPVFPRVFITSRMGNDGQFYYEGEKLMACSDGVAVVRNACYCLQSSIAFCTPGEAVNGPYMNNYVGLMHMCCKLQLVTDSWTS